jgi:hypothetical protein
MGKNQIWLKLNCLKSRHNCDFLYLTILNLLIYATHNTRVNKNSFEKLLKFFNKYSFFI